jgi:hypothetical protein
VPDFASAEFTRLIGVHQPRKREIIEKECAGLIELFDSSHGLDAVGGNEAIKAELLQLVGAMGTGKTFVAKAFVKTSGVSAVTLKNFRSKRVGSTESNLEKVRDDTSAKLVGHSNADLEAVTLLALNLSRE